MSEDRKKRVLFLSDYCGWNTGFGKNLKMLMSYLYKTGKYELCNVAGGMADNSPEFSKFPWKTIGVIPHDQNFISRMRQDPGFAQAARYGEPTISKIVEEFKPDVVFAIQDSWGALFVTDKEFFKKVTTVCWITFDSLPLLADQIDKASSIKNYWGWSQFAENEFKKLGHNHVTTQYPLINTDKFFPLEEKKKNEIRQTHNLEKDAFIVGFVFRNQLRKLVGTLISGYSEFLRRNPEMEKKSYLLLHTHFGEGWDIMRFCETHKIDKKRILCTYVCKETGKYFVKNYDGQDIENPQTGRKTLITANIQTGVTDEQLNEIYNIMDVYMHPATSGACEMPIVEAALTEKIVSCCDYSFGWDVINYNKGSIPMEYHFYTEPPINNLTQFNKSQPFPSSIAKIMDKVNSMKPERKKEMEKLSRQWAIDNYSIASNGPKIEKFIDSCPIITDETAWNAVATQNFNPHAVIEPLTSDKEWIIQLYKNILDMNIDETYQGVQDWLSQLNNRVPREEIERFFRATANEQISQNQQINWDNVFGQRGDKNKFIYIIPRSIGDIILSTALFKSLRDLYPRDKWEFHVCTEPQYKSLVDGNPYIDRWVPYSPNMENPLWLEGSGEHKGWYDVAIEATFDTQKSASYTHNGLDKKA